MQPKKRNTIHVVALLVAYLAAGFAAGCTGTKTMVPNNPYDGDLPPALHAIEAVHPLFVHEIRKLPSLSDGLLPPEAAVVDTLARIFKENEKAFGLAFEQMNQVGNPDTRAYCTPLQALYWLAAEGREREVVSLIADYSLEALLDRAWGLPPALLLHGAKMDKAVAGLKTSPKIFEYIQFLLRQGKDTLVMRRMFSFFWDRPNGFDSGSWYILAPKFEQYQEWYLDTRHRWADFSMVTERLNSPELVSYYQQLYFEHIDAGLRSEDPKDVFSSKKGDDRDFSLFAKHCLLRAGYEVRQVFIETAVPGEGHWTTCYRDHGGWYLLDNAFRVDVIHGIQGPFSNPEAAAAVYR